MGEASTFHIPKEAKACGSTTHPLSSSLASFILSFHAVDAWATKCSTRPTFGWCPSPSIVSFTTIGGAWSRRSQEIDGHRATSDVLPIALQRHVCDFLACERTWSTSFDVCLLRQPRILRLARRRVPFGLALVQLGSVGTRTRAAAIGIAEARETAAWCGGETLPFLRLCGRWAGKRAQRNGSG